MSEPIHNPYDIRLKELFSNKRSFLSLLRDCLGADWAMEINEETLTKTEHSFILQDFSEKEADVVYQGTISGEEAIFYVLLELQSAVDYRNRVKCAAAR